MIDLWIVHGNSALSQFGDIQFLIHPLLRRHHMYKKKRQEMCNAPFEDTRFMLWGGRGFPHLLYDSNDVMVFGC